MISLILRQSLLEILGEKELAGLWTQEIDSEIFPIRRVYTRLKEMYGLKSADGILFSLGRNGFAQLLLQYGEQAGFGHKEFKLLPIHTKIPTGMEKLAQLFRQVLSDQIEVHNQEGICSWIMKGESKDSPCQYFRGLLQEYMAWLCSGKVFVVDETTCRERGYPECCFRIPEKSIE